MERNITLKLRSRYKGVLWRVEISERGYAGPSEEMAFDGGTPLQITWEKRGDEFYVPVKASEATINILCKENFHYLALFTSDPRYFRVSIFRNRQLYWRGYVTSDLYSENFTAPPYTVTIKAVDGFNLLSSIPFRDLVHIGIAGRRSLWELLSSCIDLLELDLDTADWMDLYAEGMDENASPLRQTYIDLERLYYVYEEPTYRDILELCLRPFAGQIFQSNGALHIRRAVSLYRTARPVNFYRVGTEHPVGRIVTGSGLRLVIHTGAQVVTSAARECIDGMWTGDLHIEGSSTLDIVPALRKVSVDVKNKSLDNLIARIGFYDPDAWDGSAWLRLREERGGTLFQRRGCLSGCGGRNSGLSRRAMQLPARMGVRVADLPSGVGTGHLPPERKRRCRGALRRPHRRRKGDIQPHRERLVGAVLRRGDREYGQDRQRAEYEDRDSTASPATASGGSSIRQTLIGKIMTYTGPLRQSEAAALRAIWRAPRSAR